MRTTSRHPSNLTPSCANRTERIRFGSAPTFDNPSGFHGPASIPGLTTKELSIPAGQSGVSATDGITRGSFVVGMTTDTISVAAGGTGAFKRTPGKENAMSRSERLTAPAADNASVLDFELRRLFGRDGVIDFELRRLLKLSAAVSWEMQRIDATIGVVSAIFEGDGLGSANVTRKLREFHRDFDPTPDGPASKGKAA